MSMHARGRLITTIENARHYLVECRSDFSLVAVDPDLEEGLWAKATDDPEHANLSDSAFVAALRSLALLDPGTELACNGLTFRFGDTQWDLCDADSMVVNVNGSPPSSPRPLLLDLHGVSASPVEARIDSETKAGKDGASNKPEGSRSFWKRVKTWAGFFKRLRQRET
jgi:hypothetical protein